MQGLGAIDRAILLWFQNHHGPLCDELMVDITSLGGHAVLSLVVLFTLGLLVALRRYQTAVVVLVTVLAGVGVMESLKAVIGRERPAAWLVAPLIALPQSASFPSGHSMLSAIVYPTLALVLSGRVQGRRVRGYLIGSSLLLTFLIGVSRVYLGVHFFTDVVAGWTAGLMWAVAWRWVEIHWVRFRERAVDLGGEEAPEAASPPAARGAGNLL
jgi:undecaprenyl-diphosphatase